MHNGIKNIKINGDVIETTTRIDITLRMKYIDVLNVSGILVSVASMSLLNLFIILPIGVDSKNCILQCKILASIDLCKFLDALIYMKTNNKFAQNANKPLN